MAWAHLGLAGSAQSKTANQSSLVINIANSASTGQVFIVVTAKDNATTTFADNSEVTSVTDVRSNIYTKAHERTGSAGAKAHANCSIWYSKLTTGIIPGDDVTVNWAASTSNDASAVIIDKFTIGGGNVVSVIDTTEADNNKIDPGSLTSGTLANAEHLAIYGMAWERPGSDAFTADGGFAGFSTGAVGTTGGGAASNMTAFGEWDIFSGTTITANPSESGGETADHIPLLVIFDAGAAPSAEPIPSLIMAPYIPA